MKSEVPEYIIRYLQCKQPDHQGQKINLICLNQECSQHSLICSLCHATKHKKHQCKPIKLYLDELYRRYKINNSKFNLELQELQKRKILLLLNLKTCIERMAQQFCRLEEDIINAYETIKNQIYQNEHKRNRFQEFYLSMIKDNYGDPNFQVKNYLFKEEVQLFTDQDIFSQISVKMIKEINYTRTLFLQEGSAISFPLVLAQNLDGVKHNNQLNKPLFILPNSIKQDVDIFSQTNFSINSQNMSLLDVELTQMGKLRITILEYMPGSKLSFGLIKKQDYNKANFVFKDGLNCQYLDSLGKSKGSQSNYITALGLNMIIDFYVKKNNFRVVSKNNNAIFNLPEKNNIFFFFVIQGKTKIKVTYPYNK